MPEKLFNMLFELERRSRLFEFIVENEENRKWKELNYSPEREYHWFIEKVNSNLKKFKIEGSVVLAIEYMPEYFVIKPFLREHQTEILYMIISEYKERAYEFYDKCKSLGLATCV